MRSGLWQSGSGGSGILIARRSDGNWSPPSAFLLHTAALAFVIGVDVYDCVLVINSMSDLEMFTRPSTTLGTDVQLAVGPVLADGRLENELRGKDPARTVLSYIRARGEHRAVNIDGSSVAERGSENERFYGRSVSVLEILAGEVHQDGVPEIDTLYEVLKCAEGRVDFDSTLLEKLALQPAPGDALIDTSSRLSLLSPGKPAFGVPDFDDPDPFGVKALEMAGLEIREAGTKQRPPSSQFEYAPSPTSPFFGQPFNRQSTDTYITQSNRGSYMSNRTTFSRMTDAFTQTTVETRGTTPTSDEGVERTSIIFEKLPVVIEPEEIEYSHDTIIEEAGGEAADEIVMVDKDAATDSAVEETSPEAAGTAPNKPQEVAGQEASSLPGDDRGEDADDEDEDSDADINPAIEEADQEDEEDEDGEEPIVFEVATAAQPARAAILSSQVAQVIHAKGALVNIPKRVAPVIPPRSPARSSRCSKSEFGDLPVKSPLRNSFQSTMTSKSEELIKPRSLDGVVDASSEVTTEITPASPLEHGTVTPPEQTTEERLFTDNRRDSSSIYTAEIENRLSMDPEDLPKTPSTLHTSGQTSSGDEQEPRTPIRQLEDEVSTAEDDKKVSADEEVRGFGVNLEAN